MNGDRGDKDKHAEVAKLRQELADLEAAIALPDPVLSVAHDGHSASKDCRAAAADQRL